MKVFCIGLGKTGTKTLKSALEILGFSVGQCIDLGLRYWAKGDLETLREYTITYDALQDFPWPYLYKELYNWYPDAFFILTVRYNEEKWYESLCRHYDRVGPNLAKELAYGCESPYEDPDGLKKLYEQHNKNCQLFFQRNPRFKVLCWENGDSWESLCHFLGQPQPSVPFPQSNTTPDYYGIMASIIEREGIRSAASWVSRMEKEKDIPKLREHFNGYKYYYFVKGISRKIWKSLRRFTGSKYRGVFLG